MCSSDLLYLGSVCNGVREIVDVYVKKLVDLELEILKNAYMTLTQVRAEIEPFRTVFRVVTEMIANVSRKKMDLEGR